MSNEYNELDAARLLHINPMHKIENYIEAEGLTGNFKLMTEEELNAQIQHAGNVWPKHK